VTDRDEKLDLDEWARIFRGRADAEAAVGLQLIALARRYEKEMRKALALLDQAASFPEPLRGINVGKAYDALQAALAAKE
jgi:hypothetical protein